jgi:hypothetical protein
MHVKLLSGSLSIKPFRQLFGMYGSGQPARFGNEKPLVQLQPFRPSYEKSKRGDS